ncbi:MAG: ATP-binding protein [Erysipelotrichales bacterium]|nr:ATP-binding protein [Erysipelotrichales bacterium]
MPYIERHIELILKKIVKNKGVIVITGPRQVGKSTLLKQKFGDYQYITLDTTSIFESAKESPVAFINQFQKVVIDEIQRAPELFHNIKEDIDEHLFQNLNNNIDLCKFILTGSQTFALMKNVTESLAGRAAIIQMCGLSKREINKSLFCEPFLPNLAQIKEKSKYKTPYNYNLIVSYIHRGSMPELYKTNASLKDWGVYCDSYIKTYLEKDVRKLINLKDEVSFMKFLRATAARTGQQLNMTAIAEIVGKDVATIKSWLNVLQTSGLIYLLEPYSNNLNKRLVKTPKLYFMDTGLACYLSGWHTPEQLTIGASWGHIFETWVISEIIKSYYNSGKSLLPLYYYRDKEKKEVDLIIEVGNTLHPVEIKVTSDPNKGHISSFSVLKNIPNKQVGEGGVICLCKESFPLAGNNWAIPIDLI